MYKRKFEIEFVRILSAINFYSGITDFDFPSMSDHPEDDKILLTFPINFMLVIDQKIRYRQTINLLQKGYGSHCNNWNQTRIALISN